MPLLPFDTKFPALGSNVFVAPDAWITGDVTIGDECGIFFGAVLRGDILPIVVGRGTNIQDHAIVHSSSGMSPPVIGSDVTVGHRAIVHGGRIGNLCIIGMGATILDDAEVEGECIIGAHTLVTKGMKIPKRSLVVGTPGKVVRELTDSEIQELAQSAARYRITAEKYRALCS